MPVLGQVAVWGGCYLLLGLLAGGESPGNRQGFFQELTILSTTKTNSQFNLKYLHLQVCLCLYKPTEYQNHSYLCERFDAVTMIITCAYCLTFALL